MQWRNLSEAGRPQVDVLRDAIVQLAKWAADSRSTGDPVHEWVTEGRRKQYEDALARGDQWAINMKAGYSSCGDLWHFILMLVGCRDERIVNRGDDGGLVGWAVGRNLSRVIATGMYLRAHQAGPPEPGDFLHLDGPDHACILVEKRGNVWVTADYGQPNGKLRERLVLMFNRNTYLDSRKIVGVCPAEKILPRLDHPAFLPDSIEVGVPTDNPYVDEIPVPLGVS